MQRSPSSPLSSSSAAFVAAVVAVLIRAPAPVAAICHLIPQAPDTESHVICARGEGWCEMFLESDSVE